MLVKSFLGKVNMESLRLMDDQINDWLRTHGVEPKTITQVMGMEQFGDAAHSEPVVVTSIWYEKAE